MKKKEKPIIKVLIGDGDQAGFPKYTLKNPLRWPFENNTVDEILCNYLFHKIPGKDRGDFMDEMHRVLKVGSKAVVVVPYWTSFRSVMDFRYEWPPVADASFLYFNKGWRKAQGIENICKCDFDFGYGYTYDPEAATRSDEVKSNWVKHQLNTALDLQVVLTKRG